MRRAANVDSDSDSPKIFTGQGRHAAAGYIEQEIASYSGNPFIEALPPILTEEEAMEALARYPPYNKRERRMPSHLRLHAIQSALQCFVPLPVHIDLEQRFSRMIRAGYQNRNPLARTFWRNLDENCKNLTLSTSPIPNSARAVPLGFTIIGFPGVGKSTSVEAVLSLYPQVIYHTRYANRSFHVAQIVWLKLECPHNGSTKSLCLNFFQILDQLLGTDYERNYGGGRRTADELLPNMARVAAIHGIGVLVIDEINRLSRSTSGGATSMLSFFVQLTNSIGIPVVQVGTFKAKFVLSGEFHQIRRGTGQGDLVWDRMEEDEWIEDSNKPNKCTVKLGVWQLFLESIWKYQYTAVPSPLTKELCHVLYEETQGITDFAAKIYMLAQIRTIVTASEPEHELLTSDIIRSVARDSLKQAQPVLAALRRNDTAYLSTVPDINPIAMDEFIQKAQTDLNKKQPATMTKDADTNNALTSNVAVTPYGLRSNPANTGVKSTKPKSKKRNEKAYGDGDFRAALSRGSELVTPVYEILKEDGHIGSAIEYLNEG